MNYEFALDKKAIISLVACLILIGVLLFAAGLIIGRQWPTSETASTPSSATDGQRAELPKEPVLDEEAALPKADVRPRTAPAKLELPPQPQAPAPPTASQAAAAVTAAATAPKDDRVVIVSEAETDQNKPEAADPEYVTVQVGVFLDEKEASRLLQQMERRGYAPTFFSGRDAEARQWYAVRIGTYSDREQATRAAANFTKQEKMKAVVRPSESL
ncbi:MAG TPA: SPOR domain-containing protein [Pyrinomonadaceae bacterium]|nr:SPOR domain-containing protein [Pyrinomonadaceae bacterium]